MKEQDSYTFKSFNMWPAWVADNNIDKQKKLILYSLPKIRSFEKIREEFVCGALLIQKIDSIFQ
jgi:hypothetical protein